jgi:hypothetical protein
LFFRRECDFFHGFFAVGLFETGFLFKEEEEAIYGVENENGLGKMNVGNERNDFEEGTFVWIE